MTRGNARELAIHLIYGREFTGDHPADVVRLRLEEGYYEQLAVYEILYVEDVPEGVAVSEAVRLAKKYNDEMGRFVNGILGAFVRSLKEAPAESVEAPVPEEV